MSRWRSCARGRLEHRTEKWVPGFRRIRCPNNEIDRPLRPDGRTPFLALAGRFERAPDVAGGSESFHGL